MGALGGGFYNEHLDIIGWLSMKFTCSNEIDHLTKVSYIGPSWCYNQSYYHKRRLWEAVQGKYSINHFIIIWLYVKVVFRLVYSIL